MDMSDESQKDETHHLEDTKQDEFDDDEEEEKIDEKS